MYTIIELQEKIQEALSALSFKETPKELYEPINYTLSLGGKRMRPVLLLMGCDLFGGDVNKVITPAMGIEVFHNFTLLHDDIMDNAPIRRSQPTVHQKWNNSIAILSGDAMLIEAYKFIMQVENDKLRNVLNIFNDTAIKVCEGQQLDMNYETQQLVTIQDYLEMISMKTAVLLAASLQIGALIAGADDEDAQHLYNFGKYLGIAFQLQDDILDVYGDKDKFGKQVGGDIISNKKTYLLLKALELEAVGIANPDQQIAKITKETLNKILDNKEILPKEKIKAVTVIYNRLKVKEFAQEEMQSFYHKAMNELDSINVADDRKSVLITFAKTLMVREV